MDNLATVAARAADVLWKDRFAERALGITSSAIRELLKLTERPDIISFAGGLPAPETFPLAEVEAAACACSTSTGRAPFSTRRPRAIRRCASCSWRRWPATGSRSASTTC